MPYTSLSPQANTRPQRMGYRMKRQVWMMCLLSMCYILRPQRPKIYQQSMSSRLLRRVEKTRPQRIVPGMSSLDTHIQPSRKYIAWLRLRNTCQQCMGYRNSIPLVQMFLHYM